MSIKAKEYKSPWQHTLICHAVLVDVLNTMFAEMSVLKAGKYQGLKVSKYSTWKVIPGQHFCLKHLEKGCEKVAFCVPFQWSLSVFSENQQKLFFGGQGRARVCLLNSQGCSPSLHIQQLHFNNSQQSITATVSWLLWVCFLHFASLFHPLLCF